MFRFTLKRSLAFTRSFSKSGVWHNDSRAVTDLLFKLPSFNHSTDLQGKRVKENQRKNNDRNIQRNGKNHKFQRERKLVFRWNNGTEKQQAAANDVLEEILKVNPKGDIKAISKDSNKVEETNVRIFLKGIDLGSSGIAMVSIDNSESSDVKLPVVKEIPTRIALKNYSDKLSKRKEEELIQLGVSAHRAGRANDNKPDSSWKIIKVSWQISDYDLKKQKYSEIVSNLEKGSKVSLFINDKDSQNLSPIDDDELKTMNDAVISKRELKRREEVMEKIYKILEEHSSQIVQAGSIKKRIILKVTPNPTNTKDSVDKRAIKEQKKRERQEKLQRRLEKKKMREAEQT